MMIAVDNFRTAKKKQLIQLVKPHHFKVQEKNIIHLALFLTPLFSSKAKLDLLAAIMEFS